jgi:hypothetical protein
VERTLVFLKPDEVTKRICGKARSLNHTQLADNVEQVWAETAQAIGVQEDYEATWLDEFLLPLRKTLDDMLEEAQPYKHKPEDAAPTDPSISLNPIQVCNYAWSQFEANPATYRAWEREAIDRFLKSN